LVCTNLEDAARLARVVVGDSAWCTRSDWRTWADLLLWPGSYRIIERRSVGRYGITNSTYFLSESGTLLQRILPSPALRAAFPDNQQPFDHELFLAADMKRAALVLVPRGKGEQPALIAFQTRGDGKFVLSVPAMLRNRASNRDEWVVPGDDFDHVIAYFAAGGLQPEAEQPATEVVEVRPTGPFVYGQLDDLDRVQHPAIYLTGSPPLPVEEDVNGLVPPTSNEVIVIFSRDSAGKLKLLELKGGPMCNADLAPFRAKAKQQEADAEVAAIRRAIGPGGTEFDVASQSGYRLVRNEDRGTTELLTKQGRRYTVEDPGSEFLSIASYGTGYLSRDEQLLVVFRTEGSGGVPVSYVFQREAGGGFRVRHGELP
jgi:hypothetical protein